MATALNVFKTVTKVLTATHAELYAPTDGYTGVVLMAQVSNITSTATAVDMSFFNGTTHSYLLKGYLVPGNDATAATVGKLVIANGKAIYGKAATIDTLHVTLSILETANG
jgi:hypothetical protein